MKARILRNKKNRL